MHKSLLFLLICSCVFVAACSDRFPGTYTLLGYPEPIDEVNEEIAYLEAQYFGNATIERYSNEYVSNSTEQKNYRNEVILARMRVIDWYYGKFEGAIHQEAALFASGDQLISVGFDVASLLTPASHIKNLFSILSTGITGVKSEFENNYFYNLTLTALILRMQAQRNAMRIEIEKGMKLSTSDYPLNMALIDLARYGSAGTFHGAIESISQEPAALQQITNQLMVGAIAPEAGIEERLTVLKAIIDKMTKEQITGLFGNDALKKMATDDIAVQTMFPNLLNFTDEADARIRLRFVVQSQSSNSTAFPIWESAIKALQ